jgi:hypothetical protein
LFFALAGLFEGAIRTRSLRLARFPLSPTLRRFHGQTKTSPQENCVEHPPVDVIVSLFNFHRFIATLEASLDSCGNNPRINFLIGAVQPTDDERLWLQSRIGDRGVVTILEDRVGIYETWNLLIKSGSSPIITNLNADDLRLPHSICRMAQELSGSSCAGLYGDFFLSQNPLVSTPTIATLSFVSSLPDSFNRDLVLKSRNYMHCSPVWKRTLHDRVGFFDESFLSSGDTEFWLRSIRMGERFSKVELVTTVYLHNDEGLSSSIESKGRVEWQRAREMHLSKYPHMDMD